MIKSIARSSLWTLAGLFIGMLIPLLVGGLLGVWLAAAKGALLPMWYDTPFLFTLAMLLAFGVWNDWVWFGAILGGLTALCILLLKRQFPTHSKTISFSIFLVAMLACGGFAWQRELAVKAINRRYADFCSALANNQDQTAYAYLSPRYRQTVSLDAFSQKARDKEAGVTFSGACYRPSASIEYEVTFHGSSGQILLNPLDFSDFWAGGISINLEKIDGEWYIDDGPYLYGLD